MNDLSHFDDSGASRMVDVSQKPVTLRLAVAQAIVVARPDTILRIKSQASLEKPVGDGGDRATSVRKGPIHKGNVLEVARLAGIMACKRTDELIPLCHSLPLSSAKIDFAFPTERSLRIAATVTTNAQTGVEMEALTAVTVAALTVYDMCKSIDREIEIGEIRLQEKKGGKSGHFIRS